MKLIQTHDKFIDLDYSSVNGLTEIEAGQGAGKTTSLNSLEPLQVLLVSSSNNLLKQIKARMPNMDWHMHIDENGKNPTGDALGTYLEAKHCLCNLQSLHLWEGVRRVFDTLVIEESDLFFKDLYLYRPQSNTPVIKNHTQLIWRMKSTPSVICIGAKSTGYLTLFNERNTGREHTFRQNIYPDLEDKQLIGCDNGIQLLTLIEEQLVLRLSDRSKHGGVYIPTEYADHLKTMVATWRERFPELKTRIVKADMPLSENELRILASETEEQEWDLLLASPSLADGFHIMNGFDLVAGDYGRSANDIQTAEEIINAMLRVRTCKKRAIHMKNTTALEKTVNSNTILENPDDLFLKTPKHLRITNTDTGEIESSSSDLEIGYTFWSEYRSEQTLGRKEKVGLRWEERGGKFTIAPLKVSNTVIKYKKANKMEAVLRAEPIEPSQWGKPQNEARQIHTEIMGIFGEVTEQTYTRWDNGNYLKNEERGKRLFDAERVMTGDIFENEKIETDIWVEKLIRKMEGYIVVDDMWRVHQEVFLGWDMWKELRKNKDKWNKICQRIGLADCVIEDRHTSTETTASLYWFATLLRKYNYKVECVDARPQKATELRSKAEKYDRFAFKHWKDKSLWNKNKQLQKYYWDLLITGERTLDDIRGQGTRKGNIEICAFLDCYSYLQITKQRVNNKGFIT